MSSNADRVVEEWRQLTSVAPLPMRRVSPAPRPVARAGLLTLTVVLFVGVALLAVHLSQSLPSNNATQPSSLVGPTAAATQLSSTSDHPDGSPSITPSATGSPDQPTPSLPTATPIEHPIGAKDQLLVMEVTPGGVAGSTRPPDILFELSGNGRVVFRELVPGLMESNPTRAWLTEDMVQRLLSFVMGSGLMNEEPLYPFATLGPAGSTIIELTVDGVNKRVEYQLPPGNLMADTDPGTSALRAVAATLMAFDPRRFVTPNRNPTPSPSGSGQPSAAIWNGTTVVVVFAIDGSDIATLAPGDLVDPIPWPNPPTTRQVIEMRTPEGFILYREHSTFLNDQTAYLDEPCGLIMMWWGTGGPGTLNVHRDAASCTLVPATASPSP